MRGLRIDADRKSRRRLRELHNRFAGRTAVIIGMGPSLQLEDLNRLKGVTTFACNKIFLCFDRTEWRPDFYTVEDDLIAQSIQGDLGKVPCEALIPAYLRKVFDHRENITWVPVRKRRKGDPKGPRFATNLLKGLGGGGATVVFTQLQIAYHLGFSKVYLIGVDFNYEKLKDIGEQGRFGKIVQSEANNHFLPNYTKPGEKMNIPRLDAQVEAFKLAKRMFEADGRRIVNASRRTKLDVFERADFESTFPSCQHSA